jgi:hypothetical protein
MLLQWRDELDARFGPRFEIFDKDSVQNGRRERVFIVNLSPAPIAVAHFAIRSWKTPSTGQVAEE